MTTPRRTGRARFGYFREQWEPLISGFCTMYCLLAAIAFLLSPLFPAIKKDSIFARWGTAGLVIFGVTFALLFLWTVLFPEHDGRLVVMTTVSVLAVVTSVHPVIVIGLVFWAPILMTAIVIAARGLRRRWKQRGG